MVPVLYKKSQDSKERESIIVMHPGLQTILTYLEEAGHFVVSGNDGSVGLRLYFPPLIIIIRDVPSAEPRLALPVLQ